MNVHILRDRLRLSDLVLLSLLILFLTSFFLGVLAQIAYEQTVREEMIKAVISDRASLEVRP